MCRAVNSVKDVPELTKLVTDYKKKQEALEDLADSFICSVRDKQKAPKRKTVCKFGLRLV